MADDGVVDAEKSAIAFGVAFYFDIERRDLLVGLHVSDSERDLISYLEEKFRVGFGVAAFNVAADIERANADSLEDERNDAKRSNALFEEARLDGIFAFGFDVVADQRALLLHHPASVAFADVHLEAGAKIIRCPIR